eukprot:6457769-Amphidinium_carterae.5
MHDQFNSPTTSEVLNKQTTSAQTYTIKLFCTATTLSDYQHRTCTPCVRDKNHLTWTKTARLP